MLQELTTENPGEKMRGEMPSTPDRTEENPRPLARSVTNIHTVASGRKSNTTFKLQSGEEKTLPLDVTQEQREEKSMPILQ